MHALDSYCRKVSSLIPSIPLASFGGRIRLVIFDLDGTLIDSKQDLVNAVNSTRVRFDMPLLPPEQIASYVGNGAPVLIRRALGPDAPDAVVTEALEFFLQNYREHMLDHTTLYPGVRETLDGLREAGIASAILTNKPVRFSRELVDGLGLSGYFVQVYGGNSFAEKKPHPVGIERLLAETDTAPTGGLMVGDSAVDIQTARNAGVLSCGVTWGFQPETFSAFPPDYLIDEMPALLGLDPFRSTAAEPANGKTGKAKP